MNIDFSKTEINSQDVKVTFEYYCNYKKKFIDIIEGRIGETTKSCGEKTLELKIVNGILTLPPIEKFHHPKADLIERYGMQVKLDWKGRNLIWISSGQEKIIDFYNRPFDLSFEKFGLKDLEVTFEGVNLVDSPEFNGPNTQVTTYFYVNKDYNDYRYIIDTDFTRSFKWYLTPYTTINQNDLSNLGKISIQPRYHALLNGKAIDVTLDVYAKDKFDKFVTAEKIVLPLSQAAIDKIKTVEINSK